MYIFYQAFLTTLGIEDIVLPGHPLNRCSSDSAVLPTYMMLNFATVAPSSSADNDRLPRASG